MILLKGSLLLPVPQKTQCLRDQERIYGDNQQQHVGRFLASFLVSTGKDSMNYWGSGIFACKEHFSINWFSFISLCDWFRKLAPPSQPIRCKMYTNGRLRFPVIQSVSLCFLRVLIGSFWFYEPRSKRPSVSTRMYRSQLSIQCTNDHQAVGSYSPK